MAATKTKAKKQRKPAAPKNATLRNPIQEWLADSFQAGEGGPAGVNVTPSVALGYAPVFNCVLKIAGHVGVLPCLLYEQSMTDPRLKTIASRVPAYWIAKRQANPLLSAQTFRETLTMHALLRGNGRAYIRRNARGEPIDVWPLPPARTTTVLISSEENETTRDAAELAEHPQEWSKWHVVRFDDGTKAAIPDANCLHIMGLSDNGIEGVDVLTLAAESIGLGVASERAAARNFKSGSRPGFMLAAPKGAFKSQAEAQQFLKDFRAQHSGVENDGKIGLLSDGVEAKILQTSSRESQWLEQRQFQRVDAALYFAVEQILGDNSSVSYNSLEQKNQAYVSGCLMRWLVKWEQEYAAKLLTAAQYDAETHYFKFVLAALLRGTTKERYETYSIARQMKVLSANDVRELEDMDPVAGGDVYENPAIAVTPTSEPESPSEPVAPQASTRQAFVEGRLLPLFKVEAKRVVDAIEKRTDPQSLISWLGSFYAADGFTSRLAEAFVECGGTAADARDHAEESQAAVLCGMKSGVTRESLCSSIAAEWTDKRAKRVAAKLTEIDHA